MTETLTACRFVLAFLYLGTAGLYFWYSLTRKEGKGTAATVSLLLVIACHVAYLAVVSIALSHPPLFTVFEVLGVLALSLSIVYLHVEARMHVKTTGVFITAVAAAFMILSAALTNPRFEVQPIVQDNPLLILHVAPAIVAHAAFTASFIYSGLFLLLHQSLKKNRFGIVFDRLPPLETLSDMNYRSIRFGMVFLTLGVIGGAVFSARTFQMKNMMDPKILLVLAGWVIFGAAFLLRRFRAWSGRRIAYLAALGFAVLLVSMLVASPLLSRYHQFK
jgi:ABC-type uncharacterized transport system permease subunit